MAKLGGGPAAVAVSGGGDSVALMVLLAEWAPAHRQPPPTVLTVDHGLHPRSRADAAYVIRLARELGLKAHRLVWRGSKSAGNLEERARLARYRLMGDWCRAHTIARLFVAHTREDQAETFLLRLGRGSGIDGLSAMQPSAPFPLPGISEISLCRPLLDIGREELRRHVRARRIEWRDDPMNSDQRFARVRVRHLLPTLEDAGIPVARIAGAARHLARAREALEIETEEFLSRNARFDKDRAVLAADALPNAPREVGLRALSAALLRVSGRVYRPRFEKLERVYSDLVSGTLGSGRTLHGCRIAPATKSLRVFGPASVVIAREPPRKRRN